jgi:hypothetical protein
MLRGRSTSEATDPHSRWSNSAEAANCELMKGSVAKWSDRLPPKCLWDNCLEREAYVRSLTAHDIYKLNGQVPETVVSGKTADISPLAQFEWHKWVLIRDTSVTYHDTPVVLGCDLGPAIDIGTAMTRKVLSQTVK